MKLDASNVADYAETLVLQVRGGEANLDYSEASLQTVEDLLRVSDELFQRESFPETQRNIVVFYNGCYLGETIRRTLGGVWRFEPNWFDSSLVFDLGERGGVQIFPFQKVHRRVLEGPSQNLADYYTGLKEMLIRQSRG